MVLINEAQGYLTCLECHEVFRGGDEAAWLACHVGDPPRCDSPVRRRWRSRWMRDGGTPRDAQP